MNYRLPLLVSLAVLSFAFTSSNAGAQRKPLPVTDADSAVDAGWAFVDAPRGKEWYVFDIDRKGPTKGAVFGKKLHSPRHTFFATVVVKKETCCKSAQELVAHGRANQAQDRNNPRYRVFAQEIEATSWDGLTCASMRLIAEDRESRTTPGGALNFYQKGLICLRPRTPDETIYLTYSERGGPPEGSPELISEGESFLQGLKRSQDKPPVIKDAGIGIVLDIRPPVPLFNATPDIVYFVRIDGQSGIYQENVLKSSQVAGGRAYLLNVEPGRYAAVAAHWSFGKEKRTWYFSEEVIRSTITETRSGELAFMGAYLLDQSQGIAEADKAQAAYARLIAAEASSNSWFVQLLREDTHFLASAREKSRDTNAIRDFLSQAKEELKVGSWPGIVERNLAELAK